MKTETQIIEDLKEAGNALHLSTYESITNENTVFCYISQEGVDQLALDYFSSNPETKSNKSAPFSSLAACINFLQTRISEHIDEWPIIVNLSHYKFYKEPIPANTIASLNRRLIWCGFNFAQGFITQQYNTYMYTKYDSQELDIYFSCNTANYEADWTSFFYSELKNAVVGNRGINGKITTSLYKTILSGGFIGRIMDYVPTDHTGNDGIRIANCALQYAFYNYNLLLWTAYIRALVLIKNSVLKAFAYWGGASASYIDLSGAFSLVIEATNNITSDPIGTQSGIIRLNSINIAKNKGAAFTNEIDLVNGILYTGEGSEAIKFGQNGQDAGLGTGVPLKATDTNTLSSAITKGTLKNISIDEQGGLFVTHTAQHPVTATTTTITLQPTASQETGYYVGLYIRTETQAGELIAEREIVSYTANTATVAPPFDTLPNETNIYRVSGEIETTAIPIDTEIDRIHIDEKVETYNTGAIKEGVFELLLKSSLVLAGGQIPTATDPEYNTDNEYKRVLANYVRVDSEGVGSGEANFDPSTAKKIEAKFIQLKLKKW